MMILLLILFVMPAKAELFRNAYVSFEMPPNWSCKLEKTEWVCTSKYAKNVKEAIIVLTAKEAGPADTLAAYTQKLKTPRQVPNKKGAFVSSKIHSVKEKTISGHRWVDGLHEGSEIASYYTRYLATVKDRLAILVSFSAHKAHYTKYSNDFLKAVKSLKVIATKDLLAGQPNTRSSGSGQNEMIGGPIDTIPVGGDIAPPAPKSSNDLAIKLFALALIMGAITVLLLRKKK